jgi:hypothetical protein
MSEGLIIGLIFVIVLFAAYQAYETRIERKYAIDRERELLGAVLSKNVGEYLKAIEALKTTPADRLAELKLENELAQAAVRITEPQGIPVR